MSIWCSRNFIGWEEDPDGPMLCYGEVRSYAVGWSNHYPTTTGDVERMANIDTASVPVWCVPGHEDETGEEVGPWLRLDVETYEHDYHAPTEVLGPVHASIVMDEAAVAVLAESLLSWLADRKAYPTWVQP